MRVPAVSWFLWLLLAAILVLPVLLRIYAEDTPRDDQDDGEPALVI